MSPASSVGAARSGTSLGKRVNASFQDGEPTRAHRQYLVSAMRGVTAPPASMRASDNEAAL
ncbi:MAG TPA: hypothetical protein VIF60_14990 [Burkholderiaceae bacterium]